MAVPQRVLQLQQLVLLLVSIFSTKPNSAIQGFSPACPTIALLLRRSFVSAPTPRPPRSTAWTTRVTPITDEDTENAQDGGDCPFRKAIAAAICQRDDLNDDERKTVRDSFFRALDVVADRSGTSP